MSLPSETTAETVVVRLMPFESTSLLATLEGLASEGDDASPRKDLAPIVDRLHDCHSVASWLGEYVRLELRPDEVVELLEAIVAALNSDAVLPREAGIALSNIGEKLTTFGYARRNGREV